MNRKFKQTLSLLLLLLLLPIPGAGQTAFADEPASEEPAYTDMRIYFDGLLTGRGYSLDGRAYLPLEDICAFFGEELSITHDDTAGGYVMSAPGLEISAEDGAEYMIANQRYLYIPGGLVTINSKLYITAEAVAKLFGLSCTVAEDLSRVDMDSSSMRLISGSSTYYSDTYGVEEVFWLARIIHAEAGNQPLAGRIGVGNVVMNRVDSDIYPDTIYQVIFDNEIVYQFEPVLRGTVYAEPDALSLVAAYLALEGFSTVGESMYFVNPDFADDTWFRTSLTFTVTIGDHDFYS